MSSEVGSINQRLPSTFVEDNCKSKLFIRHCCIGAFLDRSKAKDYIELHDQVQVGFSKLSICRSSFKSLQTSVSLLDNLESFLSTFQKDLAAVAGQISELQDRSKDIDNRLKSRKVCGLDNVFPYSFTITISRELNDHCRVWYQIS
jgi:hypothetical protein